MGLGLKVYLIEHHGAMMSTTWADPAASILENEPLVQLNTLHSGHFSDPFDADPHFAVVVGAFVESDPFTGPEQTPTNLDDHLVVEFCGSTHVATHHYKILHGAGYTPSRHAKFAATMNVN